MHTVYSKTKIILEASTFISSYFLHLIDNVEKLVIEKTEINFIFVLLLVELNFSQWFIWTKIHSISSWIWIWI